MNDFYCVIMAGGIGSRFWPLSTPKVPKQFLDFLGVGKTLLQLTYDRFSNLCNPNNIFVITNESYAQLVSEQLPDLKVNNILREPFRKNTAPCIAYAANRIFCENPNAVFIAAPSDHFIPEQNKFEHTIQVGIDQAICEECLVTIGINPSRPETGYGYIQFIEDSTGCAGIVKKVKTFTEKPNHDLAVQFLNSGDFYWNSGIFIWKVNSIIKAIENHLPEIHTLFSNDNISYGTPDEKDSIRNAYQYCTSISIDYGIMEKAKNTYMVQADFSWTDLGSWRSLYSYLQKDNNGNAISGKKVMLYDSSNCIINMQDNKLAILQGLDDYIVVDTKETLLICHKKDEQRLRHFVNDAKLKKWL